jgi:acetoin utilization deacetylase AcuC-like enzyme
MITVFDEAQRLHDPPGFIVSGQLHASPERPERVDVLLDAMRRLGGPVIAPPPVGDSVLATVHDGRYLSFMASVWARWTRMPEAGPYPASNVHALGRPSLPPAGYPDSVVGQCGYHLADGSCPITAHTWISARASAASAVHGAKLLLAGERLAYALCRPPGHHSAADTAAGFCYLNNTAIAAELLTRAGRRTGILDIDVHHGNGTEAIFYDRADVLTVSIHADPKRFYPFFWGHAGEQGRGDGEGFNLNVPLPRGTRMDGYRAALDTALRRIADFAPQVLVLASGLDISVDDPFKGFAIETAEFRLIGKAIAQLKLPILAVQEGGYPSPTLGANLISLIEGLAS